MPQHELDITISKTGEVTVHVKNAKGKVCMSYAEWLARVVGKVEDQKLTNEYYEPEASVRTDIDQQLKDEG